MVKELKLSNGKVVLLDDEDYEVLKFYKWHDKGNGYAMRIGKCTKETPNVRHMMHREIMKAKKGEYVDHINGNKMDNRRKNLRVATNQQNAFNQGPRSTNTSGYKGVTWSESRKKYVAQITHNYKRICLGYFDCKHKAAITYNNKAKELHGEFVKLNEIPKEYFELGGK